MSFVGESRQLVPKVLDQNGHVLPDQTVTWSSSDPAIATVTADGVVMATGSGQARVTASAGATSRSAAVLVNQAPRLLLTIFGDGQIGPIRAPLPDSLVVEVRDQGGTPIPGATLLWTVESGGGLLAVAQSQTDAAGRAFAKWTLGDLVGVQTVGVSSGSARVQLTAEAVFQEEEEFSVTSITPFPIQEGQTASVTGTGLLEASVAVGGLAAEVIASAATQIDFTVPLSACLPSRETEVMVFQGESSASVETTVVPQLVLPPLPVGGGWIDQGTDPEGHCLHLSQTTDAVTYLIGVQSLAETASTLTPTDFTMSTGVETIAPLAGPIAEATTAAWHRTLQGAFTPAAVARVPRTSGSFDPGPTVDPARVRHSGGHLVQRARDERQIRALRSTPGAMLPGMGGPSLQAPPGIGDEITVRVPQSCTDFVTITTTVREVGARSIWLEDMSNPSGGFSDADYQSLRATYDDMIGTRLEQLAGAPTDLDSNGQIIVVVTKEVNDQGDILGFVSGADLFSSQTCPGSNEGEYFYGIAPDPDGATSGQIDLETARDLYPSLIAHEVTHIIHLSRQIYVVGGSDFPRTWEIEGLATFMEELVGHVFTGLASGQNIGFDGLFANLDWYGNFLTDLIVYFGFDFAGSKVPGAPQECSWVESPPNGPCVDDARMVYGVPATLLRWIADQFYSPATEHQMTRALVDAEVHGFELLAVLSGDELDRVLASWAGALVADDLYFTSGPLSFATWNFGDIYDGLVPAAQPQPAIRSYSFLETFNVRAGSSAYFMVSGSHGQISFGAPGLPSHMRLWAIRLD